jgi:hypothetical protein
MHVHASIFECIEEHPPLDSEEDVAETKDDTVFLVW